MSLAVEIAELLYDHDCVIVPKFGGFIGQYRPAKLQRERKRILPPGKDISFNRGLTRNDGLLADHLASRRNLDYAASLETIEANVAEWEKELSENGRLELRNIGIITRNPSGELQFEPDGEVNYGTHAFGLRAAAAIPVELPIEKETPIVPLVPESEIANEPEKGSRDNLFLWGAAATTALVLTAGALFFAGSDGLSGGQIANLFPFLEDEPRLYQPRVENPVIQSDDEPEEPLLEADDIPEGVSTISLNGQGEKELVVFREPVVKEAEVESTKVVMPTNTGRYHVIIGCFGVEDNAKGLVERFNAAGIDARVLDHHRGLYRVAYGSFPKKQAALDGLKVARESGNKEAWLLIK